MDNNYDVVVVGAGMGGLTSAAWLAKKGLKVLVVEQNLKSGGYYSSFDRAGFYFCPGANQTLGAGTEGIVNLLINKLGIAEKVKFVPLDFAFKLILPDNDIFTVPVGFDNLEKKLIALYPELSKNISSCLETIQKLIGEVAQVCFLDMSDPEAVKNIPNNFPLVVKYSGMTAEGFINEFFKEAPPKLKAILLMFDWIFNLPYSESGVITPLFGLSVYVQGPYCSIGGPQNLDRAFEESIKSNGGEILFGAKVEKILVKDGKTYGVKLKRLIAGKSEQLESEEVYGKYVISNTDPFQAFNELLGEGELDKEFLEKINQIKPSPSFFNVFLGLDNDIRKIEGVEAGLHCFIPTYDEQKFYQNLEESTFSGEGMFILLTTSLKDANSSPEGMSGFAMTAFLPSGAKWEDPELRKKIAKRMIERAEVIIPDLSKHIVLEEYGSPLTAVKYTCNFRGASLGCSCTADQSPLPHQTPIKNLFLSSAWSMPGATVIGTTIAGLQTADLVLKEEGVKDTFAELFS